MPHKLEFHVVFVSGEDDVHKAGDLNQHGPLALGWQSSRFCLYPQDIVIQLEGRCRMRKIQILNHQFLIPTKIEFFVGDVTEGTQVLLENARYTRLGYVSLSDNEKTGYMARELKCVQVDAIGTYLRFHIHKNHINKHNLYNQVGIVAVNVIGDLIRKPTDVTDPNGFSSFPRPTRSVSARLILSKFYRFRVKNLFIDVNDPRNVDKDPAIEGFLNKPDYISPLDDLAFAMYQDPEVAQIIRKLERKKLEAVLQERYDYAKRLKAAISDLQKAGEKLGKMQVEKRQSVENEDYDKAKVKKVQADEYRLQVYRDLNIQDLLETTGTRHPMPIDFDSGRQPTPPRLIEIERSPPPPVQHSPTPRLSKSYDERPLPAMKNKAPVPPIDVSSATTPQLAVSFATPNSEQSLPVHSNSSDISQTLTWSVTDLNTSSASLPHIMSELADSSNSARNSSDISQTLTWSVTDLNTSSASLPHIMSELADSSNSARNSSDISQTLTWSVTDLNTSSASLPHIMSELADSSNSARPPLLAEEEPEPELNQEPEPMTEVDLREASTSIDVFGYPVVSKAYSKTWSYREDALLAVYQQMKDLAPRDKEEAKNMLRAAIFLVKKGIDDKVYAVFKASLNLLRMILTEFVPKHKIPKQETAQAVEKSLQNLFHKAGDTAGRNRDDAKQFILDMAEWPDVKSTHALANEVTKPFKLTVAPRLGQSRAEILEQLYKNSGLTNGFTLDNVMGFCTVALNHNAGEVREVTERIVKLLYRDHGAPVKTYLPPDDEKTRKNTIWRLLFEFFDKVDGKPSKSDIKRQKADEETKKQAEIDALQKQLQELRQMTNQKEAEKENAKPPLTAKPPLKAKKKPELKKPELNKPPAKAKRPEDDQVSTFNTDKICIFCGERNEAFTEEGLDLHYWKSCPMLKRCSNCKQVVEIASYTAHVLEECEAQKNFGQCLRCTEAVPRTELDQHIADKTCNPSKPKMSHCPLCHENIPGGEDGWKDHLMSRDGCKQNPRRLMAANKGAAPGGGTKGGAKPPPSKIVKPTAKITTKTPR